VRGEHGQLGGLEGLAFGVLVFVMGTLVVANAWATIDAKLAAAAASREAARAYVEAGTSAEADTAASNAAAEALRGYGRDPGHMAVHRVGDTFSRCDRVTFVVEYPVPLAAVPLIGRGRHTFTATARHSEVVDPYRTGLSGEAHCVA
jgi:hypothetical protein